SFSPGALVQPRAPKRFPQSSTPMERRRQSAPRCASARRWRLLGSPSLAFIGKEVGDLAVQRLCNPKQARGRNAIVAALVFLNLLERNPNGVCQSSLAQAARDPTNTHSPTNVDVDRVRCCWDRPRHTGPF